jgi:hypothetical protein
MIEMMRRRRDVGCVQTIILYTPLGDLVDKASGLLCSDDVLWCVGVLCDASGLKYGSAHRAECVDDAEAGLLECSGGPVGFELTTGGTTSSYGHHHDGATHDDDDTAPDDVAPCFRPAELSFFDHLGAHSAFSQRVRETGCPNAGDVLERIVSLYADAMLSTTRALLAHPCTSCGARACASRAAHLERALRGMEDNTGRAGAPVRATFDATRRAINGTEPTDG